MKYYKLNNDVYAFESDGSQDDYIKEGMILMTEEDVDRHVYPEKYMTPSELYNAYLTTLRPLSRRQFKLALLVFLVICITSPIILSPSNSTN